MGLFRPDTKFTDKTTVVQRGALVVYWLGCILAVIVWPAALILMSTDWSSYTTHITQAFTVAIPSWLIGRAVLYILAGR